MTEFFEWEYVMTEKSTERVRKWTMNNLEKRREQCRQAELRYIEKNKDCPEFIERRRQLNRESMRRTYARRRAAMTPEELEEYRQKNRERMRARRAAEKAQKEKENEG